MAWASIELKKLKQIHVWSTKKDTYKDFEDDSGVTVSEDLPSTPNGFSQVRSKSEIDKIIPKVNVTVSDGKKQKSYLLRVDPNKLETLRGNVGKDTMKLRGKKVEGINIVE